MPPACSLSRMRSNQEKSYSPSRGRTRRLHLREADREGVEVGGVQHDEREEVVVPGGDQGEEEDGDEPGREEAEGDLPERAELARPIHSRRLDEGVRDRLRRV